MAKRVISFSLDPDEIERAAKAVEQFKADFIKACNELIRDLTALGIDTAQSVLTFTTQGWTGALEQSIYQESGWDAKARTGRVRTSVEYAAFVEFGTGIAGANGEQSGFPHDGYVPDGMGHGALGWFYRNPNDDKVHWTMGEPAKPFMYEAFARIRSNAGRYAATIFVKL